MIQHAGTAAPTASGRNNPAEMTRLDWPHRGSHEGRNNRNVGSDQSIGDRPVRESENGRAADRIPGQGGMQLARQRAIELINVRNMTRNQV